MPRLTQLRERLRLNQQVTLRILLPQDPEAQRASWRILHELADERRQKEADDARPR